MGNRDTRIGGGEVGVEVYGAISDLQKTVKNALLSQGGETRILVDQPAIDDSFVPIFETDGDVIYVTLAFFIPGFTDELTVYTLDSTLVTDEATYASKRKKYTITDITDADREAQRIERRVEIPLKPERLHYIPLLRAWDGEKPHTNPEEGFDYSGYPANVLTSFTTPAAMVNAPARPHVGNIIENNLDDGTSHKLDAWIIVQFIAPASASSNATGTVAISATINPTTVTGTGTTFLTDFPVGAGIEINGETHIVTARASNVSLTVDYPWKQTLSGQTAVKKTLMTFEEAGAIAVAPKFDLVDDSEDATISPHYPIDESEKTQTSKKLRVPDFFAGKTYSYNRNLLIGVGNARISSTPLTSQTFVAGNFSGDIDDVDGEFIYALIDPDNPNQRATSFALTQPSPPYLMERYEFFKKRDGTGTITTNSTTAIVGSGTSFLGDFDAGHYIEVGGESLEVDSVTDDTHLTLVTAAGTSAGGQSYVISIQEGEGDLLRGKFHPSSGGRLKPLPLGVIKTKKLITYDFVFVLYGVNGQTKSFTDSFTTTAAPQLLVSPAPLIRNGGCNISTSTATELAQWAMWNGSSFPIAGAGNTDAITTTSSNGRWDSVTSSIRIMSGTTYRLLISVKKRLRLGVSYGTTFSIRSTTAGGWSTGIKVHFINVSRNSLIDNTESVFTTTIIFNDTAYQGVQIIPAFKQNADVETSVGAGDNANHVMVFEFTATTNDMYLTDFMPGRGPNLLAYAPLADELDGNNAGNVPQTYIALPDVTTLLGEYRPAFDVGEGGRYI